MLTVKDVIRPKARFGDAQRKEEQPAVYAKGQCDHNKGATHAVHDVGHSSILCLPRRVRSPDAARTGGVRMYIYEYTLRVSKMH